MALEISFIANYYNRTLPFPIPNNFMIWLMLVDNHNNHQRLPASVGVIWASDKDVYISAAAIILSPQVRQTIYNIIQYFIKIKNNRIINLDQIINIRQKIIQNANNIVIENGGNSNNFTTINGITQILNQSCSQISTKCGNNIDQIVNQTVKQTAAIRDHSH